MLLAGDTILAIARALRRVRRVPEREWFEPIIERLEKLQPGERLIIERIALP